jgi:phospholipase C
MSRSVPLPLSTLLVVALALLLISTACGGGSNTPIVTVPPPASYAISAAALSASSVSAGSPPFPTSAITVTSANGYTGTVTLSCSVTDASNPAPTCAISPNSVSVSSTLSANPTLTLTTTATNPSGTYAISVTGKDANGAAPSNGAQSLALTIKFQHIVIIVQENRTPDNMFQDPILIAEQADISASAQASTGAVTLQPMALGIDYDISHENKAWATMCHYNATTGTCAMDQADLISPVTCSKGATNCPPTSPPPEFYYVQQSDVQPYWDMAEQYTFGDRMFQTNEGPSFPAHQFLISGTSAPCYPESSTCPASSTSLFVGENPLGVATSSADTGCTSPAAEYVALIDASGNEASNTPIYPCFEHPTLTDELKTAGVTWRYYAPLAGSIWTAPNAIQHMCAPPQSAACTAPDWANVSLNTQNNMAPVLTDIAAGQLQQVSWVIPTGTASDHAGDTTTTEGPSWVASVVNAIGASSYWSNTAIIILWDDWGGWYDHVPPPKIINDGSWGSGYVYGFRVPLIVVSPLAKPAYISKNTHDFGSILNFIEQTFNLPQLGFADSNTTDNLSDCFDFTQTPITFKPINAPLKADFFIHDKRPPTPPDND